jgi:hypothetical protein
MSMNIDSIEIISSNAFCITRPQLDELGDLYGDSCPEVSILDVDWPQRACEEHRGMLFVKSLCWSGEGSGYTFDSFKAALAKFFGRADIIVVWEGGNGHTGLRLLNGKVTEHEVVMALGKEKP